MRGDTYTFHPRLIRREPRLIVLEGLIEVLKAAGAAFIPMEVARRQVPQAQSEWSLGSAGATRGAAGAVGHIRQRRRQRFPRKEPPRVILENRVDVGLANAASPQHRDTDRYLLTATDERGELNVAQLHGLLAKLFPDYDIRGPSEEYEAQVRKLGPPDQPRARCDKARRDLGLETHSIEDTLLETGRSLVDLGVTKPRLKMA